MSQSLYSRAERGFVADLKVSTLVAIASALDADLVVELRFRGGRIDRLIDRAHASIVEYVVGRLRRAGWETVVEFSFNVFGERGSVDILAWHSMTRTLLIVEVKSRFTDLQATLMSLGRKLRLVPDEARQGLGWDARAVGRIVVTPSTTEARSILHRHRSTFEATLPARAIGIRRWIRAPNGPIAGIWLVSATSYVAPRPVATQVRPEGPRRLSSSPPGTRHEAMSLDGPVRSPPGTRREVSAGPRWSRQPRAADGLTRRYDP